MNKIVRDSLIEVGIYVGAKIGLEIFDKGVKGILNNYDIKTMVKNERRMVGKDYVIKQNGKEYCVVL